MFEPSLKAAHTWYMQENEPIGVIMAQLSHLLSYAISWGAIGFVPLFQVNSWGKGRCAMCKTNLLKHLYECPHPVMGSTLCCWALHWSREMCRDYLATPLLQTSHRFAHPTAVLLSQSLFSAFQKYEEWNWFWCFCCEVHKRRFAASLSQEQLLLGPQWLAVFCNWRAWGYA